MPEDFSIPGQTPGQISGQAPGQAPGQEEPKQRFSPPPSNVFIRTSESDLERIKSEGGAVTQPLYPDSSMQQQPSAQPESDSSEPSFSPEAPSPELTEFSTPETPPSQKNRLLIFIIIGVLIIAVVGLGYFYLWPKFFQAKPVVTTTTTTTIITTTTTLAVSPYPQVSGPFQKSIFNIEISGPEVVQAIKNAAMSELASPGTFKILIPKVHNDSLTNEEVVLSFIPRLPMRLKPYLLARKYLVYAYYGEVNPSLGLIIDTGEENKEEIKSIFLAWEKNLGILDDLKDLFLVGIPKKTAKDFKETTSAGAEIRYFTYSGKEAAITYSFSDQYLIMSSSLESVNSAISHLQGITEPIYP